MYSLDNNQMEAVRNAICLHRGFTDKHMFDPMSDKVSYKINYKKGKRLRKILNDIKEVVEDES